VKRRHTSADERREFEQAFAEARPLKASSAKAAQKSKAVAARSEGLDGNTRDRLKRGQIDPDARLDLHGFTESAAHHALLLFLKAAQSRGAKLVLVVTGKGPRASSADEPFHMAVDKPARGVLKTIVPRWLEEPGFSVFVAGTQDAHRRHGGKGALYIYLRKTRR
jgi:DNA-nicking Smr family endonuclease